MRRNWVGFYVRRLGWLLVLPYLYLVALSPGPALARHGRPGGAWERCLAVVDAHNGDVPMNTACNNAELQRRDAVLNAIYRSLRQRLPAARMGKLQEDERAWIAHRDTKCEKESVHEAGDRYPEAEQGRQAQKLYQSYCLLDETEERIGYLRAVR